MDSDELRALWKKTDEQLTASTRLNALLLRKVDLAKAGNSLRALSRGIAFELALNAIAVLLIADFAADHFHELRFFVPAVAVGLYAIALLVAGARQLVGINAVDYAEPVVAIQKELASLWVLRVRTTLAILLFGPLMWVPLLIVAARGLWGVDVYGAGAPWLAANLLFGLAVIPVVYWLARRYGERLRRFPMMRTLADQIAGFSLARASASLDSIRRFEEAS